MLKVAFLAISITFSATAQPSQPASQATIEAVEILAKRIGNKLTPAQQEILNEFCPRCTARWSYRNPNLIDWSAPDVDGLVLTISHDLDGGKVTEPVAKELSYAWALFAWRLSDGKPNGKDTRFAKRWVDALILKPPPTTKIEIRKAKTQPSLGPMFWSNWKQ